MQTMPGLLLLACCYLCAAVNPITYRRNALCCGKSRLLPAACPALKFTRKRRILEKQTNLSFGFAFSALRSNTEK